MRDPKFKPMLAEDAVLDKVVFPCIVQPKIDGVRALNTHGYVQPRSLKSFKNKCLNNMFNNAMFAGLDGELTVGNDPTAGDLCRATTAAVNTIEGNYDFHWWVFDTTYTEMRDMPYEQRRRALYDRVVQLNSMSFGQFHLVPQGYAHNPFDLQEFIEMHERQGYEGTIVRDPKGVYKYGRSTVREGGLLRIKPFEKDFAVVLNITEEMHNGNEAVTNALGNIERSTHQENMTGKGRVGTLICRKLNADRQPYGDEIKVGPGKMTSEQKKHYFEHPECIVGNTICYKHFPKGVKDKPRFPTFEYIE